MSDTKCLSGLLLGVLVVVRILGILLLGVAQHFLVSAGRILQFKSG